MKPISRLRFVTGCALAFASGCFATCMTIHLLPFLLHPETTEMDLLDAYIYMVPFVIFVAAMFAALLFAVGLWRATRHTQRYPGFALVKSCLAGILHPLTLLLYISLVKFLCDDSRDSIKGFQGVLIGVVMWILMLGLPPASAAVIIRMAQQSLPPVSGTRGTPAAYAPVAPRAPER